MEVSVDQFAALQPPTRESEVTSDGPLVVPSDLMDVVSPEKKDQKQLGKPIWTSPEDFFVSDFAGLSTDDCRSESSSSHSNPERDSEPASPHESTITGSLPDRNLDPEFVELGDKWLGTSILRDADWSKDWSKVRPSL